MRIAICDDDHSVHTELKTYIMTYFTDEDTISFDSFFNAEELLESGKEYDTLFIDIYMDKMTGIDAVFYLKKGQVGTVVFMTTSRDHAIDAFNLNAQHYILKPITQHDVHTALSRCLEKLHSINEPILNFTSSSRIITLPYRTIIYIESINKRILVHTDSKVYTAYTALDTLYEKLNTNIFMRAQRSYIVNMEHIIQFYNNHLVLDNGIDIVLSRTHQTELKTQYQTYLFELTRGTM